MQNPETSKLQANSEPPLSVVNWSEPGGWKSDLGQLTQLSELDLVSWYLRWGIIMLQISQEFSWPDSFLPSNINLLYLPSNSLCSRHTRLPVRSYPSDHLYSCLHAFTCFVSLCLKCFSFPCSPGKLLPFFLSHLKTFLYEDFCGFPCSSLFQLFLPISLVLLYSPYSILFLISSLSFHIQKYLLAFLLYFPSFAQSALLIH